MTITHEATIALQEVKHLNHTHQAPLIYRDISASKMAIPVKTGIKMSEEMETWRKQYLYNFSERAIGVSDKQLDEGWGEAHQPKAQER